MKEFCSRGHRLAGDNVRLSGNAIACVTCNREASKRSYARRKQKPLTPCTRCRIELRQRNGSYCRKCENEYQRIWWANGGSESGKAVRASRRRQELGQRATSLKANYGMTLAQYEEMVEDQQGLCLICRCPPERGVLVVDHDHATGEIRGLLCKPCNTGIGMLGDSPERVLRAVAYLKGTSVISPSRSAQLAGGGI